LRIEIKVHYVILNKSNNSTIIFSKEKFEDLILLLTVAKTTHSR